MQALYDMGLADNGSRVLYTQPSAIHGRGLFTSMSLPADTIICRRLGLRSLLSDRDKRAIIGVDGIDAGVPEDIIFKNINHSCRSNALFTDTGCLVSKGFILSDTEITIDYTLLLTGSGWHSHCLCDQPECRGEIRSLYELCART